MSSDSATPALSQVPKPSIVPATKKWMSSRFEYALQMSYGGSKPPSLTNTGIARVSQVRSGSRLVYAYCLAIVEWMNEVSCDSLVGTDDWSQRAEPPSGTLSEPETSAPCWLVVAARVPIRPGGTVAAPAPVHVNRPATSLVAGAPLTEWVVSADG